MKSKFVKIMFVAALCASVAMIGGAMSKKGKAKTKGGLGGILYSCSPIGAYDLHNCTGSNGAQSIQVCAKLTGKPVTVTNPVGKKETVPGMILVRNKPC